MIACITVASRWHPGTTHRVTRAGSAGSCGDPAICSAVIPCPVSRVKQR
jgi:hypothetical protein